MRPKLRHARSSPSQGTLQLRVAMGQDDRDSFYHFLPRYQPERIPGEGKRKEKMEGYFL